MAGAKKSNFGFPFWPKKHNSDSRLPETHNEDTTSRDHYDGKQLAHALARLRQE
jgi:hypothetical protein